MGRRSRRQRLKNLAMTVVMASLGDCSDIERVMKIIPKKLALVCLISISKQESWQPFLPRRDSSKQVQVLPELMNNLRVGQIDPGNLKSPRANEFKRWNQICVACDDDH
jgi:hypothetical protein